MNMISGGSMEDQMAALRDYIKSYNIFTEYCFKSCVVNLNSREINKEEAECIDTCTLKNFHAANKAMVVFTTEQPKIMEKKMQEAQAEAEKTVAMLKEKGIDVSQMSPEEVARAALAARGE